MQRVGPGWRAVKDAKKQEEKRGQMESCGTDDGDHASGGSPSFPFSLILWLLCSKLEYETRHSYGVGMINVTMDKDNNNNKPI